jgi:hypothetical protein
MLVGWLALGWLVCAVLFVGVWCDCLVGFGWVCGWLLWLPGWFGCLVWLVCGVVGVFGVTGWLVLVCFVCDWFAGLLVGCNGWWLVVGLWVLLLGWLVGWMVGWLFGALPSRCVTEML